MRHIFALAVAMVACSDIPIGTGEDTETTSAAHTGPGAPDGEVERAEVCVGGADLSSQPSIKRPFGGVLRMPHGATAWQLMAARDAASRRRLASGGRAVWRVVEDAQGDDAAIAYSDEVLLASCAPGQQGSLTHWAFFKPTGGIGIVWAALPGDLASIAIEARLYGLEGLPEPPPQGAAGLPDAIPYLEQLESHAGFARVEAQVEGDAGAALDYLADAQTSLDEAYVRLVAVP